LNDRSVCQISPASGGKRRLVARAQELIAKNHHVIAVKRRQDRLHRGLVQIAGKLDPGYLGAEHIR
jgi:NADP-dependent 3-hydroxy acid dehydrogenase YdfG